MEEVKMKKKNIVKNLATATLSVWRNVTSSK